jgi:hypothetical protein
MVRTGCLVFGNMREVKAKFKEGEIDGKGESSASITLKIVRVVHDFSMITHLIWAAGIGWYGGI